MLQQTKAPSTKLPFFLGYFEDSHFACPHYQSLVPNQQGPILTSMKENGGCDVAAMLGFDSTVSEQVDNTLGNTFNPSLISTSRKRRRSPEPNGDTMEQEQEENSTAGQEENTNTTSEQVTLKESTRVTFTPPPRTPPFV